MPRSLLIVLAMVSLTACATGNSDTATCAAVVEYDKAMQEAAAAALEALPEGSPLTPLMGDYAALRAELRACRAG